MVVSDTLPESLQYDTFKKYTQTGVSERIPLGNDCSSLVKSMLIVVDYIVNISECQLSEYGEQIIFRLQDCLELSLEKADTKWSIYYFDNEQVID